MSEQTQYGYAYPIEDGHRRHFIRVPHQVLSVDLVNCPVQLTLGKWVSVHVFSDGTYEMLTSPAQFDSHNECLVGCNAHNNYHSFHPDHVEELSILHDERLGVGV